MLSGRRYVPFSTSVSGTRTYSEKPPGSLSLTFEHTGKWPFLQCAHFIHGTLGATKTRSPGRYFVTAFPISTTSAPISCPGTRGARGKRYHSTISLPQMPHERTLIRISL